MAQHVEIEKNRLKELREKPAQIEEEAYGEVEKCVTTPELEPERRVNFSPIDGDVTI